VCAVTLSGALLWLATATVAPGAARDLPVVVAVVGPGRLRVGEAGTVRLTFRAPRGNVVAVIQEIEDLDGPVARRTTRQREFGVVAPAFGREAGELVVPLSFATPGWKVVRLTLVTDERETSDPRTIEVEALP
jgi:hypothetical protein